MINVFFPHTLSLVFIQGKWKFYNLHKGLVHLASCALFLMKDDAISEATDEEDLKFEGRELCPSF